MARCTVVRLYSTGRSQLLPTTGLQPGTGGIHKPNSLHQSRGVSPIEIAVGVAVKRARIEIAVGIIPIVIAVDISVKVAAIMIFV